MGVLDNKVALVTGGTSGIGAASARALGAAGATVVVAGRRPGPGEDVVASITTAGGTACYMRADVTQEDQVEALVGATVQTYGHLDIAFNNAGGGRPTAPIGATNVQAFLSAIELNLTSVFLSMKYELPALAASGGGVVVNNASTMGTAANARGMSGYIAAKHGVVGLTRTAALEYGASNVRVNSLITGPVATADLRRRLEGSPEGMRAVGASTALGRPGEEEEVAAFVVFLAGDSAAFITGAALPIDGGWTGG